MRRVASARWRAKKYQSIAVAAKMLPRKSAQPDSSSSTHFAAITMAPKKKTSNAVNRIARPSTRSGCCSAPEMTGEEVPEHGDGGEHVAGQDRPPDEHAQHRSAERGDRTDEEGLEADEQDRERDEQRRLPLGRQDQARRHHAEADERHPVEQRVEKDRSRGDDDLRRVGDALEDGAAEEGGREEGPATGDVEDEEPDGDDRRPDQACDDSVPEDRPFLRHRRAMVAPASGVDKRGRSAPGPD